MLAASRSHPAGTRQLGHKDQRDALAWLARHPVRDVFLASRILNDGALGPTGWSPLWGMHDRGGLRGILHVGPNLVPAVDDLEVLVAFTRVALGPGPTRMLLGEQEAVAALWALVRHTYPAPREVRDCQYVYALRPEQLAAGLQRLHHGRARLAAADDEDEVLELSAAMYQEEMGENPLARDPAGYRRRIRVLTGRGWTYVYDLGGRIAFKMDVGCASDLTAQIQGVYVPPELRGRGVASAAMAACCALAFDRHPTLSLYVNDFNRPAVALYERLGFRREPYNFQTIMLP